MCHCKTLKKIIGEYAVDVHYKSCIDLLTMQQTSNKNVSAIPQTSEDPTMKLNHAVVCRLHLPVTNSAGSSLPEVCLRRISVE